jgi:transcriptional regulator with XRE-family HTH domain
MLEIPFGERLRTVRLRRGYSQSQLADILGTDRMHISHFETGQRLPSFDTLGRLIGALNVSADFLLGFTDRMERVRK